MQGRHPAWPALEAAERVGEMLCSSLGPAGASSVLLPGAGGGQVRVVASGSSAASAQRLRNVANNPGVLSLLERTADALDRRCGCGTTTALTMIAGAVRRIDAECGASHHSFSSLQRIRRAWEEHGVWVLQSIIFPALSEAKCPSDPGFDQWWRVSAVLHTAIAGKIGRRSADAGVRVVVDWLRMRHPHAPTGRASLSLPHRLPLVVELGADVERSYVVRGVVVDAGLAHSQMPVRLDHVKLIVLRCPLGARHRPATRREEVRVSQSDDADILRRAPGASLDAFLRCLRALGVSVVVTTAHIEEDEAAALQALGMQAVGGIDDVDAGRLCRACGVLPLPSPGDLTRRGALSMHIGRAVSSSLGSVAGRGMMHFDVGPEYDEAGRPASIPHVIMLRVPDGGSASLLSECLQRAFRALRCWLGGAPEEVTATHIEC